VSGPVSVVSDSPAATKAVAEAIGRAVDPVPRGGLVLVLLGDLGAGKTVFTAGLARGLGVPKETPVTSPTFTVAKAYRGRVPLHHVDAYMVRSLSELEAAGLEEMGGEGRVTCVEWGDRVPAAWPADRLEVTLTPLPVAVPALPLGPGFVEPPRRIDVRATGRQAQHVLDRAGPAIAALRSTAP
jgi:tRNA threonylcarbamoyladenosine biosynthesis protein TsaE